MEVSEINKIRLANLKKEVGKFGSIAEFARAFDGIDASYISALFNGYRSFGERSARNTEKKLGLPSGYLDLMPKEVDINEEASPNVEQSAAVRRGKSQSVFEILDVRASCGPGSINSDYPEVISRLIMPTEKALELIGVTNHDGRVKVINASNDSMSPTIKPKDLLFVDTSVIEYRGEGIYLLVNIDELLCKRLQRVGSVINVKSDNPAYDSWEWKPNDSVRVVGRVLCAMPIEFKVFYRGNE